MRSAIWLSSLILLAACASPTYTLTGVPVGNQVATMNQGAASVVSVWPGSTVAVRPVDADLAGNLALYVTMTNASGVAANFGTENVSISYDGQTWLPVKTYEQLKTSLDNRAFGAKLAVALLAGLDAYASSASANYYGHGSISTPYGTSSYSYSGVDPVARQIALDGAYARGEQNMAAIDAAHDNAVDTLKAQALRTTTVGPSQSFGGLVVADEPKLDNAHATTVLVRVAILNDVHVLQFQAHRPGTLPIPAVDISAAPALALEASRNVPPAETPATLPSPAFMASDVVTASASPQPACTDADRDMARVAKKNGFAYHGACGP